MEEILLRGKDAYTVAEVLQELTDTRRLNMRGARWVESKVGILGNRKITDEDYVVLDSICCEHSGKPFTVAALTAQFIRSNAIEA